MSDFFMYEVPARADGDYYPALIQKGRPLRALLIDVSDTENYKHKERGSITLDSIQLIQKADAVFSGTIKIGVVTYLDEQRGSVAWMLKTTHPGGNLNKTFVCEARADVVPQESVDGTTPYIDPVEITSGSADFKSGTPFHSRFGDVRIAVGDIVLEAENTGEADSEVSLVLYNHSNL